MTQQPHRHSPRRPDLLLCTRTEDEPELMDDPACDPVALDNTYRLFGVINPLVASWRPVYRRYVRPALQAAAREGRPGTVLDVGCGGGDVARALARWAERDGLDAQITGIDPDQRAIRWASAHDRGEGTTYRAAASGALVARGERFDAVVSNHVLHHLTQHEFAQLLADSQRLARTVAVHNDLRRSRAAWLMYWVATLPLVRARTFVRHDGLLSIRRSYAPAELRRRVPAGWQVERQAFYRVLAVHRAESVRQPHMVRPAHAEPGRTS